MDISKWHCHAWCTFHSFKIDSMKIIKPRPMRSIPRMELYAGKNDGRISQTLTIIITYLSARLLRTERASKTRRSTLLASPSRFFRRLSRLLLISSNEEWRDSRGSCFLQQQTPINDEKIRRCLLRTRRDRHFVFLPLPHICQQHDQRSSTSTMRHSHRG